MAGGTVEANHEATSLGLWLAVVEEELGTVVGPEDGVRRMTPPSLLVAAANSSRPP